MTISAEVICDSLHPNGSRLTTFVVEYPRIIHSEFCRHRCLSRSTSSSRAIPSKKIIEAVKNNPFIPLHWGRLQKGMQADEELTGQELELAKYYWLQARDNAVDYAEKLMQIGLHKQIANRILEPWHHIKEVITGCQKGFENLFALRAETHAQPEFQKLAFVMLDEYNKSIPKKLKYEQWHLPFGGQLENQTLEIQLKVATARCGRASYYNFDGTSSIEADIDMHDNKLVGPGHMSPTEHCAKAICDWNYRKIRRKKMQMIRGNFDLGWFQYRKTFTNECRKDDRVQTKN